jgi:hypothetical protein
MAFRAPLCSSTHLKGGGRHAPVALPLGMIRCPLRSRLSGPQGWSERLAPTGIRSPDRPSPHCIAIPAELSRSTLNLKITGLSLADTPILPPTASSDEDFGFGCVMKLNELFLQTFWIRYHDIGSRKTMWLMFLHIPHFPHLMNSPFPARLFRLFYTQRPHHRLLYMHSTHASKTLTDKNQTGPCSVRIRLLSAGVECNGHLNWRNGPMTSLRDNKQM